MPVNKVTPIVKKIATYRKLQDESAVENIASVMGVLTDSQFTADEKCDALELAFPVGRQEDERLQRLAKATSELSDYASLFKLICEGRNPGEAVVWGRRLFLVLDRGHYCFNKDLFPNIYRLVKVLRCLPVPMQPVTVWFELGSPEAWRELFPTCERLLHFLRYNGLFSKDNENYYFLRKVYVDAVGGLAILQTQIGGEIAALLRIFPQQLRMRLLRDVYFVDEFGPMALREKIADLPRLLSVVALLAEKDSDDLVSRLYFDNPDHAEALHRLLSQKDGLPRFRFAQDQQQINHIGELLDKYDQARQPAVAGLGF